MGGSLIQPDPQKQFASMDRILEYLGVCSAIFGPVDGPVGDGPVDVRTLDPSRLC